MSLHPSHRTLQRHLDRELPNGESWEVERHLIDCPPCRQIQESYERLHTDIRTLPNSIEPPEDLWPEIAARIAGVARPIPFPTDRAGAWSRPGIRRAAGLLAIAATLTIGIALGRQFPIAQAPTTASAPVSAEPVGVLASYDEASYEAAIADLEAILVTMRDELQPETVASVEANLAIIDEAIADSREALLADPANEQLHRHLSKNMQMKIGLLRMVAGAITLES